MACCPPVLVEVHQGVVEQVKGSRELYYPLEQGSLPHRVGENMAARASSDAYQHDPTTTGTTAHVLLVLRISHLGNLAG